MRIAIAVLADAINVRERMINILSAGVTTVVHPEFPAPLGVDLALMVELEESDVAQDGAAQIVITVLDPQGEHVARVTGEMTWTAGEAWPQYIPAPVSLRDVPLPKPGRYSVVVGLSDQQEITLSLKANENESVEG